MDPRSALGQHGNVRTRLAVSACLVVSAACGRQNYDAREDAGLAADTRIGVDASCAAGDVRLLDGSCAPPLTLEVAPTLGARSTILGVTVNGPATLHAAVVAPGTGATATVDDALAMPAATPDRDVDAAITQLQVRHPEGAAIDLHVVAHRRLADGSREALVWSEDTTSEALITIRTITFGATTVETAVFVPDAARADPTIERPAILFLHGWGGATAVPDASGLAMDGGLLERIVSQPGVYEDFPFFVVAPHCIETVHGGCWGWTNHTLPIAALDDVASAYTIDGRRTYVSGLSTGGQGTFTVASMHSERFAAAIPIASTYDMATPVCQMLDVPVWAFHGEFDTLQPRSNTETYLATIRDDCAGAPTEDPSLTLIPCRDGSSDHCGWVEAFDGTHGAAVGGFGSVFDWLLSHSR